MYHIAFEILLLGLPKVQILGLPLPDVPPSSASHRRSHAQASPATPPRFSPPIHHRTRSLRSHPSPLVSLPSPIPLLCKPTFFPLPSNCHARLPANQYCYHLPSQSSGVQRPVHFAAPHFVYVYLFFQTTIRRYFIPFPRMLSSTEWSCQCDSTRDGSNFSFSSSLTHSCFEFEFCNSGPT